jgi:hypothetical protein
VAYGTAVDNDDFVYVSGRLDDGGGPADGFVRKLDRLGATQWQYRFGGAGSDLGTDVAIGLSSHPFVVGNTSSNLGSANSGGTDAVVISLDANGNELWVRQFGTSGNDTAYGVATDPTGNVYVAGTFDLLNPRSFVSKFDASGNLQWTQQIATSQQNVALSIAADLTGNTYVTGWTRSSPLATDIQLLKYNPAGGLEWSRQIGSDGQDVGLKVAVDGLGAVFVTGYTTGNLFATNNGSSTQDVFVMQYDGNGNRLWEDQFGDVSDDSGRGIAFGMDGELYLAGTTSVSGPGVPIYGSSDVFLRTYDVEGQPIWTDEIAVPGYEELIDMSAFQGPAFYVVGRAWATDDPNGTGMDAFVYRFVIPEPSSVVFMVGLVVVSAFSWRSRMLIKS